MEKQIIFLDTETTGFGSSARIVQMAWLVHDLSGNEIKAEDHIIKPVDFEIPEETTAIHGITTQYALDKGEDLETIMLRYAQEYDISFASVLGVFQVVMMNLFHQQPGE